MFQTFYKSSLYEPFLKEFNLSLILPLLLSFVMRMGCRKFEICRNDKVINCINRSSRHNWKQNSKLEDCSIIFNGCVTVKMSKIVTTIGWLIVKTLIVADSKKYFIFITLDFENIFWSSNISSHFVWWAQWAHASMLTLVCFMFVLRIKRSHYKYAARCPSSQGPESNSFLVLINISSPGSFDPWW